jgi:hypothetical protein
MLTQGLARQSRFFQPTIKRSFTMLPSLLRNRKDYDVFVPKQPLTFDPEHQRMLIYQKKFKVA